MTIKRLVIEMNEQLNHKVKTQALKRNITVREYVTRLIKAALIKEETYDLTNEEYHEKKDT